MYFMRLAGCNVCAMVALLVDGDGDADPRARDICCLGRGGRMLWSVNCSRSSHCD